MANRTRRIKDPHMTIEMKLMQIKFEEISLREKLKKNEKEYDKWSKKLFKLVNGVHYHG